MTYPSIIALTGPAGCGKDTIADWLVAEYGYTKLAFADALREEVCAAFGIPVELLTDRETKEIPTKALALTRCADHKFVETMLTLELDLETASDEEITAHMQQPRSPRRIMQVWGTEYRKGLYGDDYWITEYAQRLAGIDRPVVTPDCRFDGEAEFISLHSGEIWRVYRPDLKPVAEHTSERPLQQEYIDRTIENRGSLQVLYYTTDNAMAMIRLMRRKQA